MKEWDPKKSGIAIDMDTEDTDNRVNWLDYLDYNQQETRNKY